MNGHRTHRCRWGSLCACCAALLLALAWPGAMAQPATPTVTAPGPAQPAPVMLRYGPFGEVAVYPPAGKANSIALFISGDGGWNLGVVGMARHLTDMHAIVAGLDIRRYLRNADTAQGQCRNLAAYFEGLAHALQRHLALDDYLTPVLVGYSSGATLAYATAVQAPKGTFGGALSLGFCPDLALARPPCRIGALEYTFAHPQAPAQAQTQAPATSIVLAAARRNATPWIAFQGDIDQVCDAGKTRQFVAGTGNAGLVWLPKVGHGFSVERNWLPQFRAAYARLTAPGKPRAATAPALGDLPLTAVPATAGATPATQDLFAVLLSGDGGWAGLDQDVAATLAALGIPVVGFDSLRYFWRARTPEAAARDLARIVRGYGAAWRRPRALLIGYSLGADVLPFLYTRLPADVRAAVRSVTLIGPGKTASFEFHVADWLDASAMRAMPVMPEIARIGDASILCIHGVEEADS